MAPFKGENLSSPWALGFAALGVGLNYLGARLDKADRDFWDVREARIQGDAFRPRTALGVYGAFWVPISLGAAVSEESIFRGMIQTGWEDRWGKTRGLVATSALFGIAHYDGSGPAAGNAAFAVLAGMYLGWRVQAKDYRLSQAVAAHFWFDVAAGLTLFLADPDSNPLGAKVEFNF